MALDQARLEDRYADDHTRVFLTGPQALVRALLSQARLDRAAGHDTAGFVSGYRGSPLASFDATLQDAGERLEAHRIRFSPGVNEDLAATAIWGTQQIGLFPGARHDGVFALWYGKGPGVDRSGDALRHANFAGTAPLGGVLAVAGDDHAGISSTTAHQSEYAFIDAQIPVLAPANVQDVFDYALAGIALSRASGCWCALKCPTDIVEQAATIDAALDRFSWIMPEADAVPPGGLHIRWPDRVTDQEARLAGPKLAAARRFVRDNRLDRAPWRSAATRTGIIAGGKAYQDLREALDMLGIGAAEAERAGIALYKPALVWPLEPEGLRAFAHGLERLIVIEEKRPVIEPQLRDLLYDIAEGARPAIIGRTGAQATGLPLAGTIGPRAVARALAPLLAAGAPAPLDDLPAMAPSPLRRPPHFCSGCPHNTSTRTPEGQVTLAGIGCHTLALWSDPGTRTLTQMGGEGASWIGMAPFTDMPHVFANIGDGTYYHSGFLAIRAAVAAGVTITYRLLYNDAVAMTGGQKVEGDLTVPAIARELAAEGVARIVVAAEDPGHYPSDDPFPPGVTVLGRDGFACAQAELAEQPGVSVLIFDQTCAAEKRRRRRRGELADPDRHVVINTLVCEGCGDCQRASHCLSVVPVATPFGEKRQIDLASCNKDETCLDGYCPAMVTVEGGRPRKPARREEPALPAGLRDLPTPTPPALERPWRVLIAGIGGSGIVTAGHLLGLAAHLDGGAVTVMDQTGLAQRGGSVTSHVTFARADDRIGAARIDDGRADVVLGCDLVVAADRPQRGTIAPGRTRVVVNTDKAITGAFLTNADMAFPADRLLADLAARAGGTPPTAIDATRLADRLAGSALAANVLMLGFAWQMGLIPVSEAALLRAVVLNGRDVAANRDAFAWGRRAAHDMAAVRALAGLDAGTAAAPEPLAAVIDRLAGELSGYGGAALAKRYRDRLERIGVRAAERRLADPRALVEAVAWGYFRVLAAKDEFEVARLFTDGRFAAEIAARFEGDVRLHYHMAPALIARRDRQTGSPQKRRFGPAFGRGLAALARLRRRRGGLLDPFRFTAERALERRHLAEYEEDLERIERALSSETIGPCLELARLPLSVKGFGHVRRDAFEAAAARRAEILTALGSGNAGRLAAE